MTATSCSFIVCLPGPGETARLIQSTSSTASSAPPPAGSPRGLAVQDSSSTTSATMSGSGTSGGTLTDGNTLTWTRTKTQHFGSKTFFLRRKTRQDKMFKFKPLSFNKYCSQIHHPRARQAGPSRWSAEVSLSDREEKGELYWTQHGHHLLPSHVQHRRRPNHRQYRRGHPPRPCGGALHHDLPSQARGSPRHASVDRLQLRVIWSSGISSGLGSRSKADHSTLAAGCLRNTVLYFY